MKRTKKALCALLVLPLLLTGAKTAHAGNEYQVGQLEVKLRKFAEWTDEENGDARITLQYASNSGARYGTENMDVVLIQDKSGSMDSDYGYHLYRHATGVLEEQVTRAYQPIRNNAGYSESAATNMAAEDYFQKLTANERGTRTYITEYTFSASCQLPGHYYFLISDDDISGKAAGFFVPGTQLYNLVHTDLHHYVRLSGRDEALALLADGRRVMRGANYYGPDGNAITLPSETEYFLDVSSLCSAPGWSTPMLRIVDDTCQENDRLSKSQEFMTRMADMIFEKNPENTIAYVPFWCDVPVRNGNTGVGVWKNYDASANAADAPLVERTSGNRVFNSKIGSYALDFSGKDMERTLKNQISQDFTYNGTNWSAAFDQALAYVRERRKTEPDREILVVFLTDGYPQGFAGKSEDVRNPLLNGVGQVAALKAMDGVTIFACGIGVNEADTTGLASRLDGIDSTGMAAYARYTTEFDALFQTMENRVDTQYMIPIEAKDLIYQDTLSEDFTPIEEKLCDEGQNWNILDHASPEMSCGVPTNVYQLFALGADCVYVRDSKTVYWYIGDAGVGGFEDAGHSIRFPVSFAHYEKTTSGYDVPYEANTSQKATYYSTTDPSVLREVTLETPEIVFNREKDPVIRVKLSLAYADPSQNLKKTFAVYAEHKQAGAPSAGALASGTIVIPKGQKEGSLSTDGLNPGVYYLYMISEENTIISGSERRIVLGKTAEITTQEKEMGYPDSRKDSDQENLANYNNYLKLTFADGEALYLDETRPEAELTVIKTISADEIWWEHGNPTFLIRVTGILADGSPYTAYHTYEFTPEYVQTHKKEGMVSMTYTFRGMAASENTRVKEIQTARYRLEKISGTENVRIKTEPEKGLHTNFAVADLVSKPLGTQVEFRNRKSNWQKDDHTAHVSNVISYVTVDAP